MRLSVVFILFLALTSCASMGNEEKQAAMLHQQIGTSHLMNGNYPLALTELLIAEDLDPSNPSIQNNLGLAYFVRDRLELSEKHTRQALKLDPKFSDARNNLARILIERSKFPEAIKELQPVLDDLTYTSPEKPLTNMGVAYFKMGQFEKAKGYFAKAIDYKRDDCQAQNFYGRTLYEMKDFKRAQEALDRAVGFCMRGQFDEPHYYSALTLYQLGQKSRAVTRFEEVIKLYPHGNYVEKSKSMLETIKR